MAAIPLANPIEIPPVAARSYPDAWISGFRINAPSLSSGNVTVELTAFDAQTGELAPGGAVETISTDELFLAVSDPAFPEAKQVYDAIVAAVAPLREWPAKRAALKALAQ